MLPQRKKSRLHCWDYGTQGIYFLTLCSQNRKPIFSTVVGRGILDAPECRLLPYGRYVLQTLRNLEQMNGDMTLHTWVIMPNHVHILVEIGQDATAEEGGDSPERANARIPKLISSLKRYSNRLAGVQLWQNGYYDHIIRDERDFIQKWQYIENNPAAWLEDEYFPNDC